MAKGNGFVRLNGRRSERHPILRWGHALLLIGLALMGCGGTAPTGSTPVAPPVPDPPAPTVLRILWIGNSYSYVNDLPALVTSMATAAKQSRLPAITAVLTGSATLKEHAARADLPAIIGRGWDVVILQEQSTTPLTAPDSMFRYGFQLGTAAKAAGAQVVLFETWPRGDAVPTLSAINAAYATLATALGARVAPVGQAWGRLLGSRPDLQLYQDDLSHPSAIGTYLAACVFYGLLYNSSAMGLPAEAYTVRTNRYATGLTDPIVKVTLSATDASAAQRAADQALGR